MQKTNSKGFTLIELLVVIAIIGLLSTLAVVALNSARQKSRDSKRVADVKQMQTALELYFADKNGYPAAPTSSAAAPVGVLGVSGSNAVKLCDTGWIASAGTCNTTYMGLVPKAPTPGDNGCTVGTATTAGTNDYVYSSASTSTYGIAFCLGAAVGDLGSGVRTASPNGIN
ncbi:MAG: hypothetical protein RLZZ324_228 [Candidatus Parcubacteria bacterium]|jgi:general secretion pathway protein G